jgi:hypothetical protein
MGDVPSAVESYTSTNSIITSVTYTSDGPNAGHYRVNINSPIVFGGGDYHVMLTWRAMRSTTSAIDNDLYTPVV